MDLFVSAQCPVSVSSESGNKFLGFMKDGKCFDLEMSGVFPSVVYTWTSSSELLIPTYQTYGAITNHPDV
jgi:hypothetical protein